MSEGRPVTCLNEEIIVSSSHMACKSRIVLLKTLTGLLCTTADVGIVCSKHREKKLR